MAPPPAVIAALTLLESPANVWDFRARSLPEGITTLLELVADDVATRDRLAQEIGCDASQLTDAAGFFVEQVLLATDADAYRVLGATQHDSLEHLRRQRALLLRWLHPDKDPTGRRAIFIPRVMSAWDAIKTPEARAAYDATLVASARESEKAHHGTRPRQGRGARSAPTRKSKTGPHSQQVQTAWSERQPTMQHKRNRRERGKSSNGNGRKNGVLARFIRRAFGRQP